MPAEVNGIRPRRSREIETRVVSKIGTASTRTGIIQAANPDVPLRRSLAPKVANMKPRNIAPPSPMKIFAGLKFQQRKPSDAPRTAVARVATKT